MSWPGKVVCRKTLLNDSRLPPRFAGCEVGNRAQFHKRKLQDDGHLLVRVRPRWCTLHEHTNTEKNMAPTMRRPELARNKELRIIAQRESATDERRRGGPKLYHTVLQQASGRRNDSSTVRRASTGINRLVRLKRVLSLPLSVLSLIEKKADPHCGAAPVAHTNPHYFSFTALATATVALGAWRHAHYHQSLGKNKSEEDQDRLWEFERFPPSSHGPHSPLHARVGRPVCNALDGIAELLLYSGNIITVTCSLCCHHAVQYAQDDAQRPASDSHHRLTLDLRRMHGARRRTLIHGIQSTVNHCCLLLHRMVGESFVSCRLTIVQGAVTRITTPPISSPFEKRIMLIRRKTL